MRLLKINKNNLIEYSYKNSKEFFTKDYKYKDRLGLVLNVNKCKMHTKDKDFIFYYEILDLDTQNIITPTFEAISIKKINN
jgi:hypothetical protein